MENKKLIPTPKDYQRPEIINLLLKRVNAFKNQYRQNIALIGHQSLGKTSLIFDLIQRLGHKNFLIIYLAVKQKSFLGFAKNFIGVALFQFLVSENIPAEDDFDFLIDKCRSRIPKTVQEIIKINKLIKDEANPDEIYAQILELPQLLHEETKKQIIFILDEFQNLENYALDRPFLKLSDKIMVQKHIMYIVISSAVFNARHILTKKFSLLFGNFEIVNITPFSDEVAKEYIEKLLNAFSLPEEIKRFLIHFTGGYPFYLQVICEQITRVCLAEKSAAVTQKSLITALKEILLNEHGILNQYFLSKYHWLLNANHNNLYPTILLAIANGRKKPSDICSFSGRKSADISRHINRLIEMDVIGKKGIFCEINDPLFISWVKYVFCRDQSSYDKDISAIGQRFEHEMMDFVTSFCAESQKEIGQRVKEVFELFANDIIELDRKRFMLTQFDKIDMTQQNGTAILTAKRLKKNWLCYIEKDFIDETKINNFLLQAKKSDCAKKILVPLEGIELNARLKALEAKIWIWDQHILNNLFTLFEKPRFIK